MKKIAILTSRESWFKKYIPGMVSLIDNNFFVIDVYEEHEEIRGEYFCLFILSYFKIIPTSFLELNKYNLVVHESYLPRGRGWAPLFYQILDQVNEVPMVLFEAKENLDSGDIFFKKNLILNGTELNEEIREKQAQATIELCLTFLKNYPTLVPEKQKGTPTYYKKRTKKDSELDINKTIKEQFNLLRIVNNDEYPAYFYFKDKKFIIKILSTDEIEGIAHE
ncbi:MAG: methionyl-tRNA formyltransferase [Oligoflexia bacterium]|nr:methionyl-tRNA formyltransferase [Oligoflexia bacterium]